MVKVMDKSHALSSATTLAMRGFIFTIVILSFIATVLVFTGILVNSLVDISVPHTISVTNATSQISYSLIPQLDATIGMVTSCAAGTCDSRTIFSGPLTFLADPAVLADTFTMSDKLTSLYTDARNQFVFGYDIGSSCGASATSVRVLSTAAIATASLGLIFLAVSLALETLLFTLLARRDVLVGVSTINMQRKCAMVGKEEVLVSVVIRDLHQHLKYEKPFFISGLISAFLGLVFSIVAMAVSVSLTTSKMKCGHSTCQQFKSAMDALAEELPKSLNTNMKEVKYKCTTGATIPLFIVTLVFAALAFVGSIGLLVLGMRTGRRRQLMDRLGRLTRQSQSVPLVAEYEPRQIAVVQVSKMPSGEPRATPVSPSYTHASQNNSGVLGESDRLGSYPSCAPHAELPPAATVEVEEDPLLAVPPEGPRTLGSGIELLKRKKQRSPQNPGSLGSGTPPATDPLRYSGIDLDRVSRPLSRNVSHGDRVNMYPEM